MCYTQACIRTNEVLAMQVHNQAYGVATYDAIFKSVLSDDAIRPSFFHAFVPGITVMSSERLDNHMNPLKEFQVLRRLLTKNDTSEMIEALQKVYGIEVTVARTEQDAHTRHEKATQFLKALLAHYDDLARAFPKDLYDGSMDFVCKLDNGEYALIETQVIVQDYWDKRALAYVAAFYGNQIRKGGDWGHIKRVIGVNILGGGIDQHRHWKDTPDQFMRHYMFEEQLHKEPRFIEELQLIQYSIQNEPKGELTQEQRDWLMFFKEGYRMSEAQVAAIQTDAVQRAFERAKFSKMSHELRDVYEKEDLQYKRVSGAMEEKWQEGVAIGREEGVAIGREEGNNAAKYAIARQLLREGLSLDLISRTTGLSIDDINPIMK